MVDATARDASLLDTVAALAQSQFVPGFLKELPYNSKVMALSNEMWNSMVDSQQKELFQTAQMKVEFYKSLYDNADVWMNLDEHAAEDEKVVPVPLNMLP